MKAETLTTLRQILAQLEAIEENDPEAIPNVMFSIVHLVIEDGERTQRELAGEEEGSA